jgi:hypothetical protein
MLRIIENKELKLYDKHEVYLCIDTIEKKKLLRILYI